MVKVMKANGIADSDEEAINLGNMLLRYGLIEARAKDAGIFRNNKTTYVIARAGRSTGMASPCHDDGPHRVSFKLS
jgi:hypothetical protein